MTRWWEPFVYPWRYALNRRRQVQWWRDRHADFTAANPGPHDPRLWALDRVFWIAIAIGLVIRVVPLIAFVQLDCIRDECIYTDMARDILNGEGLTTSKKGWLPSPGYPYLLAFMKQFFGMMAVVKGPQVAMSLVCIGLVYGIAHDLAGRRAARIAAVLFAVNPTIAWFTNTMWIETIYIFFLLASASAMMVAWRNRSEGSAVASGLLLGGAILFRGVATYLPPLWILAAVFPSGAPGDRTWLESFRARGRNAVAMTVAAFLTVLPYSVYGSLTYGGFMVTDATVGHVLYLGNNDFPPLTFDYGIGMLTQPLFGRYLSTGRAPCNRDVPPVQSSNCEVKAAVGWIKRHPRTFVARVPVRLAQLLNPNSFLTRHVRWGYWEGMPRGLIELLVVAIIVNSLALTLLGTLAAWARATGPYAVMAVGTTVYTVFTIALMYGMTRFRLPLEALWTVYLAIFLADPRGTLAALVASPIRLAGALLTLPPLLALSLWYLPTGFPVLW